MKIHRFPSVLNRLFLVELRVVLI